MDDLGPSDGALGPERESVDSVHRGTARFSTAPPGAPPNPVRKTGVGPTHPRFLAKGRTIPPAWPPGGHPPPELDPVSSPVAVLWQFAGAMAIMQGAREPQIAHLALARVPSSRVYRRTRRRLCRLSPAARFHGVRLARNASLATEPLGSPGAGSRTSFRSARGRGIRPFARLPTVFCFWTFNGRHCNAIWASRAPRNRPDSLSRPPGTLKGTRWLTHSSRPYR